jgi:hypothetical protein
VELRREVIPVIIWATGTISKSFTKYLNNICERHDIKVLQKAATLDTGHTSESINVRLTNFYHRK